MKEDFTEFKDGAGHTVGVAKNVDEGHAILSVILNGHTAIPSTEATYVEFNEKFGMVQEDKKNEQVILRAEPVAAQVEEVQQELPPDQAKE